MPTFRITYVESILREAVIDAHTPEMAEEAVMQQIENAEHHHSVDVWNDDFQVEQYQRPAAAGNRHCIECGSRRE